MTAGKLSRLVPKLRFPEFRDVDRWRVRTLNSLLFETKHRNRALELGAGDVLSVSGAHGCVNQIEFMGRSYAGANVKNYHVVESGDMVYTKSPLRKNPYGIIKENKGGRGIVSTLYAVYRPFPDCSATYLDHYFSRDYNLNAYLHPIVKKGAKNDMKVNNADVLKGNICVPELEEQKKIADCFDSLDDLIAVEGRKLQALRQHKQGLMQQLFPQPRETRPCLRFPEFEDEPDWNQGLVGELIETVVPPKKLKTSDYLPVGRFPVIDQSQNAICGWTDDEGAVITKPLPVVVFGDHTCSLKLVEQPFAQGADGIKILTCGQRVTPAYLFHYLSCRPIVTERYKRHFSDLKERVVSFPMVRSGEQQKIADCLSSLALLIASQSRMLESLNMHRQGLLQQLFVSQEEQPQ